MVLLDPFRWVADKACAEDSIVLDFSSVNTWPREIEGETREWNQECLDGGQDYPDGTKAGYVYDFVGERGTALDYACIVGWEVSSPGGAVVASGSLEDVVSAPCSWVYVYPPSGGVIGFSGAASDIGFGQFVHTGILASIEDRGWGAGYTLRLFT